MKKLYNKWKYFICKIVDWIKKVTKGPADFLEQGKAGGMIMCALLTAQFLYGLLFYQENTSVPGPVFVALLFGVVVLAAELTALVLKLVIGGSKRPKIYSLLASACLATVALVGSLLQNAALSIVISLLIVLSVDVFGRCIFGFVRTRRFKQVFGYVALSISAGAIVLFGLFFRLDSFGEDRIEKYLAIDSAADVREVPGFSRYLDNGEYKVSVMDYGQDDTLAVVTECVDLSKIVDSEGIFGKIHDLFFDNGFENVPVAGRIWYPEELTDCPVMFIAHGNHDYSVPSHLGYDYLGEYLASNGYVVISVDENILNGLGDENDARAVLLLENIKAILLENTKEGSAIYGRIDPDKIAIAGHSRGGEMVATAYLFNDLEVYPDDGNITLDYHFNISSIIAIAPTVDQYMPADHAVRISDVDYLLIHGANDQDVYLVMGQKQYNNVCFTGASEEKHLKASVYIMGANHGQFNTAWGRYDQGPGSRGFSHTNHFLKDTDQQLIAKAYIRTFLDKTLLDRNDYETLLMDCREYGKHLPQTVYITNYMDSDFESICSFDEDADIARGTAEGVTIRCHGMKEWKERVDVYGSGGDSENYVLECSWEDTAEPGIEITFPATDLSEGSLSFRIADMREGIAEEISALDYLVELYDVRGNKISVTNPRMLYPSLAVQLSKQDVLFNDYEYKHQMQTVQIDGEMFDAEGFDYTSVNKMVITITEGETGHIILDDVGLQKY